jgi:hypothetical protein
MGIPRIIAIQKQPYNYYLLYEITERLGSVGITSLRLNPIRSITYVVTHKTQEEPQQVEGGPYTIHRVLRTSPFEHEYPFTPVFTGVVFTVQFDTGGTATVPVLNPANHSQSAFGKKYQEMVPAFFFAFEPTNPELDQLRDVQKFMADSITIFRNGKRAQLPLTHFQIIPTHVLDDWLEYCVLRKHHCPITTEPCTLDTICSTPCFHVFRATALETWVREHQQCPTCRTFCTLDSLLYHSSLE